MIQEILLQNGRATRDQPKSMPVGADSGAGAALVAFG